MIGARALFASFMDYFMTGKYLFGGDSAIEPRLRRKKPKKEIVGTRNVISSGGTYRRQRKGPRGKAAIKAAAITS